MNTEKQNSIPTIITKEGDLNIKYSIAGWTFALSTDIVAMIDAMKYLPEVDG